MALDGDSGENSVTAEVIEAAGRPLARIRRGTGPVVCVALHAGHALHPAAEPYVRLSDAERLREEDPHTARFAPAEAPLVEVVRSRFEVDLNRERGSCVYRRPEDAWGLLVFDDSAPESLFSAARAAHDTFYRYMAGFLDGVVAREGRFVVFDLHSYNHRRGGPEASPSDPADAPEVNLGTRSLDALRWGWVAELFIDAMSKHGLDTRENVKFGGGAFARWVNRRYAETGCALAIEFKKTFMDEWTGRVHDAGIERLASATAAARDAVCGALAEVASS